LRTIGTDAANEESALRPYLSAFVIYHDEADYLREWLEFHKLVGFERFYMYNNFSTDHHREVLAPYIADGTVVHHEWPVEPAQMAGYRDVLARHGNETEWLGFFDIDEFLFSPTGEKVSDILRAFEQYPGVVVNEITFGTSGHTTQQPGLAIENFVRRCELDKPRNRIVKSLVRPPQVAETGSDPHYFRYVDRRKAVTENKEEVRGSLTQSVSVDLLRINHYMTRSQAEREKKNAGPDVLKGGRRKLPKARERDKMLNDAEDTTILRFAPALREALGMPPEEAGPRPAPTLGAPA
jgi:Glycosyltransferase family 92